MDRSGRDGPRGARTIMDFGLDMDGVLVDLNSGILDLFGIDRSRAREITQWDPVGQAGLPDTVAGLWDKVTAAGPEFWECLPKTPWADELVRLAGERGCIITAPMTGAEGDCYQGKLLWVRRYYPHLFKRFVCTKEKGLVAKPSICLIDDKKKNIQDFRAEGGRAMLWPTRWTIADYDDRPEGEHETQ
jgi:5'(3')-deoxyribonucleotidase